MERLTKKDEYGNADILGIDSGDLQLNLDFESFNKVTNALNKLAEYEDLEEQEMLLRLPCRVGDTVFPIFKYTNCGEWFIGKGKYIVTDVYLNINRPPVFKITDMYGTAKLSDFGKTIFLTKAEAEEELRKMNGGDLHDSW